MYRTLQHVLSNEQDDACPYKFLKISRDVCMANGVVIRPAAAVIVVVTGVIRF
jgi:hypothetical protein